MNFRFICRGKSSYSSRNVKINFLSPHMHLHNMYGTRFWSAYTSPAHKITVAIKYRISFM